MRSDIYLKFKNTVTRYHLLEKNDRVVVGVSGGPDSVALLLLMSRLKGGMGLSLCAAHLDHMLRGKEAEGDAEFVRKLSASLGVPCVAGRCDVRKLARREGLSIEEAGRNARYDFFAETAAAFRAGKIAVGHTLDDQSETILMRIIRGSGSLGLAGMPMKRGFKKWLIIRPLIETERKDIEAFLRSDSIPYRRDLSNRSDDYLRNRVRHKLIPALLAFNPRIKNALFVLGQTLGDEYLFLSDFADKRFNKTGRIRKHDVIFDIARLNKEPVAIGRLIIRRAIKAVKGDLRRISFEHWNAVERIIAGDEGGSADIPGGVAVKKISDRPGKSRRSLLVIARRDGHPARRTVAKHIVKRCFGINIPGKTAVPELGIKVSAAFVKNPPDFKKLSARSMSGFFDVDRLKGGVFARLRRDGDRMAPLGMAGKKKLHDIFVDEKVPHERRARVPVLSTRSHIIWVPGVKFSDYAKITPASKKMVRVRVKKG